MSKIIAVIGLMLCAGCISIPTHEKMMGRSRNRIEALEKENERLQSELGSSSQEGERLKGEVERVRGTYEGMVQELKDEIAKGQVNVEETDEGLTVTMGYAVLFQSGKADLQPDGKSILLKVSKILKEVENKHIQVEGHTDNVPISGTLKNRFQSNWDLSAARSASVVHFLEKKGGIPSDKLILAAFADTRPLAANDTPDHRSQNRRVEIKLVP